VTLQGIVKTYEHLIVMRVLLGVTEAGFFPAATYLLTTWYSRWQLQTRMAIFYSAASLAGSFSGLLAFAIQHMEGIGGLGGWRWIFILEGIVTVVVGCAVPWILPDSPETASFLTEVEKAAIQRKLQQEIHVSNAEKEVASKFQWKYVREALLEWKIYFAVLIYWGNW
jgi:MFS family permease